MNKTYQEVLEVIYLGKPDEVIDLFIGSYLATPDPVQPQYDEEGNEIEQAPLQQKEVTPAQIAAFRREHYRELRAAHYPPPADYLDGVVKGDAEQMGAYVEACLAVKARFPK